MSINTTIHKANLMLAPLDGGSPVPASHYPLLLMIRELREELAALRAEVESSRNRVADYKKAIDDVVEQRDALRAKARSHDRACDSHYARGMLDGWNYCVRNADEEFNEHRLRLLLACGEDRRQQRTEEAAPAPAAVPEEVDLWSFLRSVLKRGAAIESQFSQQGYETFVSEIEAAARTEDKKLRAMLAATSETQGWKP